MAAFRRARSIGWWRNGLSPLPRRAATSATKEATGAARRTGMAASGDGPSGTQGPSGTPGPSGTQGESVFRRVLVALDSSAGRDAMRELADALENGTAHVSTPVA